MTVAEILKNEDLRREEFPVARTKTFLAHAGVCPLPRRVSEAIAHAALNSTTDDQELAFGPDQIQATRVLAAKLIHARPEEVALVGPTSLGLSMVANGLKFRRTDHVVVYHDDYPSNVYPWMALADRGVEVRFLNIKELGRIRERDVTGQVDENTRLVALASCHFIAGWRIDYAAIGRYLRDRRILFCVDGIQTLGAFPMDVEHVDFLAADAHKWLLGPCAAGILYVRKELHEQLTPTLLGWHNLRCPDFVAQEDLVFRSDARRYEAGSHNLLGLAGMRAGLELLLEVGVENIAAELLRKRTWLVSMLRNKGWDVLQAGAPAESASGIVAFSRAGEDMSALHQKLAENHVVTSLRRDRAGRYYLRLSPHFYNSDEELARAVALL